MMRDEAETALLAKLPKADWDWDDDDEGITVPTLLRDFPYVENAKAELLDALKLGVVRSIAQKTYIILAKHGLGLVDHDSRIKSEDHILRNSYSNGSRGIFHETLRIGRSFWSSHFLDQTHGWVTDDGWFPSAFRSNWSTGTFTHAEASMNTEADGTEHTVLIRFYGVRLSRKDIDIVFASDAPFAASLALPSDNPVIERTGGRRAARHGEPIAKITLRLSKLSEVELAKYTADSLAVELAQQYSADGENPPSAYSCRQFALGILRALRN